MNHFTILIATGQGCQKNINKILDFLFLNSNNDPVVNHYEFTLNVLDINNEQ